ncbi:substrate-binding periplasmic protein [Psychrobium sp. nBUS_13]|uniref:substrate-binding periplasmic protein n=1 Tax=Psychrobium sp. nBUS_13 TaxID=3395319 RepID=UPI003EB83C4B
MEKFNRLFTYSVLAIVSVIFSNTLQSEPITGTKKQIVNVGFMSSIKRVDEGKYVGALPDIMRATASEVNFDVKLQPMPIKRLLKSLEIGRLDAVIGLFKRQECEVYADYLALPIGWGCANLFVPATKNQQISGSPSSFSQKRIGMLRGANWGQRLTDVFTEHQVSKTDVASYSVLAKMLDKGRLDTVVASTDAFQSAANKLDFKHQFINFPLSNTNSLAMSILVSKHSKLA